MAQRIQRILVVDDDREVAATINYVLSDGGFEVVISSTGKDAIARLNNSHFDLAIIDLRLPDVNGLDIVKSLDHRNDLAIIIVTGQAESVDKVIGLELGADDYIPKPFEPRELLARVRSLLRRMERIRADSCRGENVLQFDGWLFDRTARAVQRAGAEWQELTPTEFRLLDVLSSSPNRVLTRDRLLDLLHADGDAPYDRSIDLTIMRLRRKIEQQPARPKFIRTMRNEGYMFSNGRE